MNTQKLTGKNITDLAAHEHSALVETEDGTLQVIPSLRGKALTELPDTSTVLRYPGKQWADELLDAERDRLGQDAHPRTVATEAAKEAAAELHNERARESMLPPFWLAAEERLTAAEAAHWRVVMERLLPPLYLP